MNGTPNFQLRQAVFVVIALVAVIACLHYAMIWRHQKANAALLGLWHVVGFNRQRGDAVTVTQVQAALNNGADANAADEVGITPLMMAAYFRHDDCVSLLISKGADVNAKQHGGWTPLMWAARAGNIVGVKILLSKGADATARDVGGKTALSMVHGHPDIVAVLTKAGGK